MKSDQQLVKDSLTQVGTEKAFQEILDATEIEPTRKAMTITENGNYIINPAEGFEGIPGADITVNVPAGEIIPTVDVSLDSRDGYEISVTSYPQSFDNLTIENYKYHVNIYDELYTIGNKTLPVKVNVTILGDNPEGWPNINNIAANLVYETIQPETEPENINESQVIQLPYVMQCVNIGRAKTDNIWSEWGRMR